MRNPSRSPQLAETAAREKLSITVSTMDIDSDQSVSDAVAAIHQDHGPIEVLVSNAGVEPAGSVEELALAALGQLWRPTISARCVAFRLWFGTGESAAAVASST